MYEQIIDLTVQRRKEHDMGVMSLFGELDDGPSFDERPSIPDVEFDKMPRLANEKEMLGLYISDHPLLGLRRRFGARPTPGWPDSPIPRRSDRQGRRGHHESPAQVDPQGRSDGGV